MSNFDRRYSEIEMETAISYYLDRKVKPLRRVVEMAEQGQLVTREGIQLRPFTINAGYLRSSITLERKRRAGTTGRTALADPDDVLAGMRKRMIMMAEQELRHAERQKRGKRDPEHLRQIARLLREVSALPKPGENRSRAPGQRDANGVQPDRQSANGLAGKMVNAMRRETASEHNTESEAHAENATDGAPASANATQNQSDGGPDSLIARRVTNTIAA